MEVKIIIVGRFYPNGCFSEKSSIINDQCKKDFIEGFIIFYL
jgi:hypothetical protein